jgi:hypothetical protein
MVTGITSALLIPAILNHVMDVPSFLGRHPVNLDVSITFPLVLVLSVIGCLLGTLLTKPEDDKVLKDFYRRVRPWGFWGPVLKKVLAEDPGFQRNRDFWRDMFNIVIGITWQISLVALPLYIVIQQYERAALTLTVTLGTSAILKHTWFDHLAVREIDAGMVAVENN